MYNPKVSISVLDLSPVLYNHLLTRGVKTVGQLMDVPASVGYEQAYDIPGSSARELRSCIRDYLHKVENAEVPLTAGLKVEEQEVDLSYPSDEDTEQDKSYKAGYRAGWAAAVKILKDTLTQIDQTVSKGMN